MEKQGLNPNVTADVQKVTVGTYKDYIAQMENSSDTLNSKHQRLFQRLSITYSDVFQFIFDNKPWDPTTMAPQNDISLAYVAAVMYYKNGFQCSSGNKDLALVQEDLYESCIHCNIAAETEILQKSTVTAKSK